MLQAFVKLFLIAEFFPHTIANLQHPNPGIELGSLALQADLLPSEPPEKPH